jgi:hypothetical protein
MQQPLAVHHFDKNLFISWRNSLVSYHSNILEWNRSHDDNDGDDRAYRMPIMNSTPRTDQHRLTNDVYAFDRQASPSGKYACIVRQTPPVRDYFKSSLFACLTCFWMIGGIVCLIQSIRIRYLLKKNRRLSIEEAHQCSNRLYTNLILTYVFGGMIIGVLIMTVLVTFFVGIKGYFNRSL